jgi:hypothetical protein
MSLLTYAPSSTRLRSRSQSPHIVEADGLMAALAQRPVRPEVARLLRLKLQPAAEVAADEDGGLSDGRLEQRMDGYPGLRAWSNQKQIVTEITNG